MLVSGVQREGSVCVQITERPVSWLTFITTQLQTCFL